MGKIRNVFIKQHKRGRLRHQGGSDDNVSNLPKSDFSVFPLINLVCLFLVRWSTSRETHAIWGHKHTSLKLSQFLLY